MTVSRRAYVTLLLDKNYYTEILLYSLNGDGNCFPRSNDLEDFVSHTLDLMGFVSIFNLSPILTLLKMILLANVNHYLGQLSLFLSFSLEFEALKVKKILG